MVQYEVWSYQAEMGRRKDKRREERAQKIDDEESSETLITSCMARIKGYPLTDGLCIPDSEEEREKQDLQEHTGGKDQNTQWVHGEFIVSSETICPPHTQWVHGEFF